MLNTVCDGHDHDPGLPDRDLRLHALAAAIRTVEGILKSHGYAEPDRSAEVLHVSLGDGMDLIPDEDDRCPTRSGVQVPKPSALGPTCRVDGDPC